MKMYKIVGVKFPLADGEGDKSHRVVKGLIDLVNSWANLDSGIIQAFALTDYKSRKRFMGYSGKHAAVGYCFHPGDGEVYLSFKGKINPEVVKKVLSKRYSIEEIDRMPGVIFPVAKKDLAENIEERRAIEENGYGKPDERKPYVPPAQIVKATTLKVVLEKRVARGEITRKEADRILEAKNK